MALFFDRNRELESLDRVYADVRRRGQLALLSGRRGAGKTTLIQRWLSARRKRALVWTAQENGDEFQQALSFAQALASFLKRDPAHGAHSAAEVWEAAFGQLGEAAELQPRIVVIDQATDIMPLYSALVNGFKRAWDHRLQFRAVLVILIGDHGRRIYEHLQSYARAPLYGRFTALWEVDPVGWADFSTAFRRWPLRDRLLAYAITGGWLAFAQLLRPEQAPRWELMRLVRSADYSQSAHALVDTVGPTKRPRVLAVLRALAVGPANQVLLAQRTRLSRRAVNAALVDLETAELVKTGDVPSEAPLPWTERVVFRLIDHQVRFALSADPTHIATGFASAREAPLRTVAQVDSLLADVVSEKLLVPWLFRAPERGRLAEAVDDLGPLTAELPCDAAWAALDRRHRRILVCGIFSQSRPLGARRVHAFAAAARTLLGLAWPGWAGRVLFASLAGFTAQARQSRPTGPRVLLSGQTLARDLARWSRGTASP